MAAHLTRNELGQGYLGMGACLDEWARQVCDALADAGPMGLACLARRIKGVSTNEIAMAIGWLAHEGRVQFREQEGMWEVAIRRPSS
ncbi:MAG: winged helix-turn-helix domain-containing protein [Verrucomicrobia bacterium]|jgi:hypothetical protein|nr:winged helix-turn-helix domain-containing protein [Verrucomicrobiota bacterium]